MLTKKSKCIDCKDDELIFVIAKRCCVAPNYHYQKHKEALYRSRVSLKKKKQALSLRKNKNTHLNAWFSNQIAIMPRHCENCNEFLNPYAPWGAHAYIAHILPKRNFKSVMVHPKNRLFLCIDCHHKFDHSLSSEIVMMKCYKIAVARLKIFIDEVLPEEIKSIPACFINCKI